MLSRVAHVSMSVMLKMAPRPGWAAISISDPGDPQVALPGWYCVLHVQFHDALEKEDGIVLIDGEIARRILAFIRAVEDRVTGIMVHCRVGVSRSGAVAHFIARKYRIDKVDTLPNREGCDPSEYINPAVLKALQEANG